jgi:hypothetical protein
LRDGKLDPDAIARFGSRVEGFGCQINTVSKALRAQQGKK